MSNLKAFSMDNIKELRTPDGSYFLFDAELIDEPAEDLFCASHWKAQGKLIGSANGRGSTLLIQNDHAGYALRHYLRGGLIRHFNKDRYLWTSLESTRAWQEFHVLFLLFNEGLPSPQPVAAHVRRHGFSYQADIITALIKDSNTLASLLKHKKLDKTTWKNIGKTIRLFHDKGLDHADLNAHNILFDKNNKIYVIDFDRAVIRADIGRWKQNNLNRLLRSLKKLASQNEDFHFSENEWSSFLSGYQGQTSTHQRQ